MSVKRKLMTIATLSAAAVGAISLLSAAPANAAPPGAVSPDFAVVCGETPASRRHQKAGRPPT
jgi:hypothetical protein